MTYFGIKYLPAIGDPLFQNVHVMQFLNIEERMHSLVHWFPLLGQDLISCSEYVCDPTLTLSICLNTNSFHPINICLWNQRPSECTQISLPHNQQLAVISLWQWIIRHWVSIYRMLSLLKWILRYPWLMSAISCDPMCNSGDSQCGPTPRLQTPGLVAGGVTVPKGSGLNPNKVLPTGLWYCIYIVDTVFVSDWRVQRTWWHAFPYALFALFLSRHIHVSPLKVSLLTRCSMPEAIRQDQG